MKRLLVLLFSIFILTTMLSACDIVDGVMGYKQREQEIKDAKDDINQLKDQVKVLTDTVTEDIKKDEDFADRMTWWLWVIGIGGFVVIVFSPLRNLIQRVLFKIIPYKPRRFDKDKE